MFESLTEKLQQTFKKLRGQGRLTEKNVSDALREVNRALLEADVNYKVVKTFVNQVKNKALGQEVLGSLTPELQIVKIVSDELTHLMGGSAERLKIAPSGPTTIMLVGLYGAGKTTAAAKLARRFHKEGRNPLLVAADIYRPAAIKQLQVLGAQIGVPVFSMGTEQSPVAICQTSIKHALNHGHNFVIIDTAGRLHVEEELMEELRQIKKAINPTEILLIADSMTGQDAVNVAEQFNNSLDIDGVILTKLDGDARGGAALSIRAVTQKPIKFVSIGEKIDDSLEEFHPERMTSRILGQGDIMTLLEKAEEVIDEDKAKELEKKLTEKHGLDFEDLLDQFKHIKKMGSLEQLIEMVPGMSKFKGFKADETQLKRMEAIISSMTPQERRDYRIINGSRRARIAQGSGTSVQAVNLLIDNLKYMNKMVKQLTDVDIEKGSKSKKGRAKGRKRRRIPRNLTFNEALLKKLK
jgi:signal recognition particle subunit SRP54